MEIQIHQLPPDLERSEKKLAGIAESVINEIRLEGSSCQFVFVDNPAIQKMHAEYLDDPGATDVITFNLGDEQIEGEIYISFDQARQNARDFGVPYDSELLRLMIHGLLHLRGYDDKSSDDRTIMKKMEDQLVERYAGKL